MMSEDQPVFVIDTNILVDYIDIIPGKGRRRPYEPTIDLSNGHLIIPTVVIRELSNFKGEKSDRGVAARTVLRMLRDLFENKLGSMEEIYNLKAPIETLVGTQLISILPIHKDFWRCLPFHPSDRDMDGQIILTALAASLALNGKRVDGSEPLGDVNRTSFSNVTLLTNDNGLAIRARERGLRTKRYGHKYPEPYTGRRNVKMPKELLADFYSGGKISLAEFKDALPDNPVLVANEFIVMELAKSEGHPAGFNPWENLHFEHVGRYNAETEEIERLRYVRDFPVAVNNVGQAIYAEALMDQKIAAVVCTGPAGSGKTYMATVFGYHACKDGLFIGVTVVPCESRSDLGALPGDLDEKMDPEVKPIKNALRNYMLHNDSRMRKELETLQKYGTDKKSKRNGDSNSQNCEFDRRSLKAQLKDRVDMIWDNWFSNIPVETARGQDFAYELAIYDEFQDQNATQADTLIKRIGTGGKIIITGDIEQIHVPYLDQSNNGLVYASRELYDDPMVAQVHFTENEVVRHPLVKEIARRQKAKHGQSHDFDAD